MPTDKENLLQKIGKIKAKHDSEKNINGEEFNIFNILKARRAEVGTHSRYIFELLNPTGSHGEGSTFLSLFIQTICPDISHSSTVDKVRREEPFNGRRIDFTIHSPANYLIGVELKIDAHDQPKQLFDYHKALQDKGKHGEKVRLVYLTIDGHEATKESTAGMNLGDYQTASFAYHVLEWLNKCIAKTKKTELIAAIKQYIHLVESITGVSQTLSKEISKEITKSEDSFKSAIEISKALSSAKAELQFKFWSELETAFLSKVGSKTFKYFNQNDRFEKQSSDIIHKPMVIDYVNNAPKAKPMGIKYLIHSTTDTANEPINIYLYIRLYKVIHYGVRLETPKQKPITKQVQERYLENFQKKTKFKNPKYSWAYQKGKENWFLAYTSHDQLTHPLVFSGNLDEYTINVLINQKLRKNRIANILTHIEELCEFIPEIFKDNIDFKISTPK